MSVPIGILTISDRASRGEYEDRGGPAIADWLTLVLSSEWTACPAVVPDERPRIESTLIHMCDELRCPLVLTTGGTGPSPRDVTPEATEAVCDRMMPGFGELMRFASLKVVPTAILSRQCAGTRGSTLIVNLPGNPSAVSDCLEAVFPAIPYCIDLMGGPRLETHVEHCDAFRPRK